MKKNPWALVTGCPNGFSLAIIEQLISDGFNIVVQGRDEQSIREAIAKIRIWGGEDVLIESMILDVLDSDAPQMLTSWLETRRTIPQIIVHHVGGTLGTKTSLADKSTWTRVLTLNCLFAFEVNRLLIEKLHSLEYARIINIGSVSATMLRGSGPYACAKSLLHSYTKTLGRELAATRVGVSCISLGAFETSRSSWAQYRVNNPQLISDFIRHHQSA